MFWLFLHSRFLFWTNWNNEKPRIQRSNLKGLESRDVITKDILTPNGLTLDHVARKLYWSDARLDKIERCDMDGANRIVSFAWQVLRSKVVSLLHFFIDYASVVSYVTCVLSLFVPHLSFFLVPHEGCVS